jgi:lysozyme family protein
MRFDFKAPIWPVLITQIVVLAVGYIELQHKVKFHDAWIHRRIDVSEKIARLEERMRLAELEIDEMEERMGNFHKAIKFVLANEGEVSNESADAGGKTKFGISQKSYPDWDIENLTKEDAIAIYRQDFWQPYQDFEDRLATKIFDIAVNMGHRRAVQILQRALRCIGARHVEDDGILGPVTKQAADLANVDLLLTAIKSEAAGVYRNLAATNTSQQKFLKGWLRRAYL